MTIRYAMDFRSGSRLASSENGLSLVASVRVEMLFRLLSRVAGTHGVEPIAGGGGDTVRKCSTSADGLEAFG